jgi:uncharacterized protein YpmS
MNQDLVKYRGESFEKFIRLEILALSLGKLPIPMLTITDNVETYMEYPEDLRLNNKIPQYIKK